MTGYGRAVVNCDGKKINIEVKSLNSKQLDIQSRIAPLFREKEMELRQMVAEAVVRGKVDFALWAEQADLGDATSINVARAESYYRQMAELAARLGLPMPTDVLSALVKLPDVLAHQEETLDDRVWQQVRQGVAEALQQLTDFRRQEGAALERKFCEKIDAIEALMLQLEPYEKSRVEKIRQRITDSLAQLPGVEYDQNRLEQELIYYIEKLDISEEKQRLENHLRYFRETMDGPAGQGKKLGFIAQEMGREINTTGSKSNQAEMQNLVVRMKDELEQIKEQVLNVL